MKRIYKICGIIGLSCAVLLSSIGLMFSSSQKTLAYSVSFDGNGLQETYVLGDTFIAPTAKVVVGSTELTPTKQVLYYPDGRAFTREDRNYTLENAGEYVLRYFANHNGKNVYAEETFMVDNGIVSLSGRNSTAYYGNTGQSKGNHEGLIVSLVSGEVFTYQKPLNLNNKTELDTLISLFAIPDSQGTADVTEFTIRLTDAMDESNFVEISQWANPNDPGEAVGYALYGGARAHNQTLTGMHYKDSPSDNTILYEDNNYYSIYQNLKTSDEAGYPSYSSSLTARAGYEYQEGKNFCLPFNYYFNYGDLKVFSNGLDAGRSIGNNLIADFNDAEFFETLWDGFTTGDVYLSIYSKGYVNTSFNFVIEKIYDEDLSALKYVHKDAPQIVFDIEETATPFAVKDQAYNIIPAKAFSSIDGVIDCDVLVYEDYYGDKKAVSVVNGAFTPNKLNTTYHIVYKATDSFGLETVKVREVKVRSQREVEILIQDGVEQTYTGISTLLKHPEVSGTNGEYTFEVIVSKDNFETVIEPTKDGDYEFYTLDNGEYTVTYKVTDYNGEFTDSYTLNVQNNPNSVFIGESNLPKVFVKGGAYSLPELQGKLGGTLADISATIKYAFDDANAVDYTPGTNIVIQADEKVTITYSLEGTTDVKVYEVPVTDVSYDETLENINKGRYFYSKEFSSDVTETSAIYTNVVKNKDITLSYVKPVLVANMSLSMKFLGDVFDAITFRFTDTTTDNVLNFRIEQRTNGKVNVTINGRQDRLLTVTLMNKQLDFKFDSISGIISVLGKTFTVDNFEQFTNHLAYFEMEFENAINTKIELYNFCGQSISNVLGDMSAPAYYLDMEEGRRKVGDYLVIGGYYVEDVFSFNNTKSITVKGPNNQPCVAEDGTVMSNVTDFSKEYVIKLDKVGTYTLTGTYGDGVNTAKINMLSGIKIQCVDTVPPVITVPNSNKNVNVKVGKTYTLPKATAVDNNGQSVVVNVMVMDVDGKVQYSFDGKFKFEKKGTYVVMFYAEDSNGNIAIEHYTVKAS